MDESHPEAIACENCQTIGRSVAQRRTSSGRRTLCTPCHTQVLSSTRLSSRETEVYSYADAGYTNEDIAQELDIDSSTVSSHLASVRQKFQNAVELTDRIEPASATSARGTHREFDGEPPRGLEPGVVVKLDEPNADSLDPGSAYTHGIVRRVLTRSNTGIPTRVSFYPINPAEQTLRQHSPAEMPAVVDTHVDFIDVVFPKDVLLKDLPLRSDSA